MNGEMWEILFKVSYNKFSVSVIRLISPRDACILSGDEQIISNE